MPIIPERFLVIDDSASDRAIVARYLKRGFGAGVRCVEAETGAAALAAVAAALPDCVLLDFDLPDMTGLELLAELKARYGALPCPVILLTGSGSEQVAVAALMQGAQDYLVKQQISAEQVHRAVVNATTKVALQREIERQQRELELQYAAAEEARRQVTTILQSIRDAFLALDDRWQVTYANSEAEQLVGQPSAVLLGQPLWAAVPAQLAEQLRPDLEWARLDGSPATFDVAHGDRRYAVRAFPAPEGMSLYFRDVTARRRAEEALRESEEFQRQLVDSSPDCIKVLDAAGHVVWMSPNGQQIMEVDDFSAVKGVDWRTFWPDQMRPAVEQAIAQAKAGQTGRFEGFSPTRKGTLKYWEVVVSPLRGPSGAPERLLASSRDITERKAAEQQLQRQAALLDQSHDAIMIWDLAGGIQYWNQGAAELYGWSAAEAAGRSAPQLLKTIAPLPLADFEALLLREGRWEGELQQAARDGRALITESRCVLLRYDDGAVLVLEANRDITERKRAEVELRRRESEVRTVVQNTPDVIARFDRQLRHVYVNAAVERATGLPARVFIGKTNRELGMPPHLCDTWDAALQSVFDSGVATSFEFIAPTSAGPRYYQSQLVPELDNAGSVETVLSIARDVSLAKRAEQALRFLSDASVALSSSLEYERTLAEVSRLAVPLLADSCAVSLLNDDGTLSRLAMVSVDAPQQARALEGRTTYDPDAPFGPSFSISTGTSQILNEVPDELVDVAATTALQQALLRRLGLRAMMTVPLLVSGRAIGAINFAMTSSQRRFAADDLVLAEELARRAVNALENSRLYREAQEAIRERDAFLSIASHELKNPLTTLLGRADLLRRRGMRSGAFGQREQDDLQIIVDQGRRINQLLTDLLGVTRLPQNQFSLELVPVDLNAVVERVVSALAPTLTRHQFQLIPHAQLAVRGDPGRLEQIFTNLVTNAAKYSPAGGRVMIELSAVDGSACVAVKDQGIGIPSDALPHLFKRFYRVPAIAGRIDGTGIGLYVVKELVERHGGAIEVVSTPEHGSTFTVRLPLVVAAPGTAAVNPTLHF